jgi:hypothetical protein
VIPYVRDIKGRTVDDQFQVDLGGFLGDRCHDRFCSVAIDSGTLCEV